MKIRGRYERGSTLAEFAIASTVVMLMLFGVIECGRALFDYHLVSTAARLGSRYAMVHGSDCVLTLPTCSLATSNQIQTFVRNSSPGVDPNALTVTTTYGTGTACLSATLQGNGCSVTVSVSYPFSPIVPLLNLASVTMQSSSTMTIAQ